MRSPALARYPFRGIVRPRIDGPEVPGRVEPRAPASAHDNELSIVLRVMRHGLGPFRFIQTMKNADAGPPVPQQAVRVRNEQVDRPDEDKRVGMQDFRNRHGLVLIARSACPVLSHVAYPPLGHGGPISTTRCFRSGKLKSVIMLYSGRGSEPSVQPVMSREGITTLRARPSGYPAPSSSPPA